CSFTCYTPSLLTAPSTHAVPTPTLHDALPILVQEDEDSPGRDAHHNLACRDENEPAPLFSRGGYNRCFEDPPAGPHHDDDESSRSEEHTSELQSRENIVCRLLLEKKTSCCTRN